jgi:hypothetical protein
MGVYPWPGDEVRRRSGSHGDQGPFLGPSDFGWIGFFWWSGMRCSTKSTTPPDSINIRSSWSYTSLQHDRNLCPEPRDGFRGPRAPCTPEPWKSCPVASRGGRLAAGGAGLCLPRCASSPSGRFALGILLLARIDCGGNRLRLVGAHDWAPAGAATKRGEMGRCFTRRGDLAVGGDRRRCRRSGSWTTPAERNGTITFSRGPFLGNGFGYLRR